MGCERWNEQLVEHLYDDSDPGDPRLSAFRTHLASCATCTEALAALRETRGLLQQGEPLVGRSPRVLLLPRRPAWSFAAGFATAAMLLLAGAVGGYWVRGAAGVDPAVGEAPASGATRAALSDADRRQLESWLEGRLASMRPQASTDAVVTRAELQAVLARWQQQLDARRRTDLDLILDEIAAAELRTGASIGETQRALQYVAVANDPRVSLH